MNGLYILLALVAIGFAGYFYFNKRQSVAVEPEKNLSVKHSKYQPVSAKPETVEIAEPIAVTPVADVENQEVTAPTETPSTSASSIQPAEIIEPVSTHLEASNQTEHSDLITTNIVSSPAAESQSNTVIAETVAVAASTSAKQPSVPEDSTLKRHFLTQIRAEIEASSSPRPTDSTLRRHYDAQIKNKIDEFVAAATAKA